MSKETMSVPFKKGRAQARRLKSIGCPFTWKVCPYNGPELRSQWRAGAVSILGEAHVAAREQVSAAA